MVLIRIHPNQFLPGGLCHGKKNIVISVNTGKAEDNWVGKRDPAYGPDNQFWRGPENALMIDATGTQIPDFNFANIMKMEWLKLAYGTKILDFVDRGLIEVSKDGVVLTVAQIVAFTYP